MKKNTTILTVLILMTCQVFAQVKMPAPSPVQTIKQDFGIGSIELTYSRPSAKERKVFGDLVPYGKLWRTGANTATRIAVTEPIEIAGKKLDTGSYALYSIPDEDSWEIILNKGTKNWGTDGYKENEDVVRFKIISEKKKTTTETFTIQFTDITTESCYIEISWEKTFIKIPVTANFKDKIKQQLEAAMQTDKKPYWQAAQFYNEYDKNLPKALDNVTKAITATPKAFWMLIYKARIQKEMGDNAGALESSKQSLALAKEANNDDYVRMNEKLQKELRQ
ncbi:MAG: DUF2911 domain-containing protein [Ferruginibacter sp.]